MLTRNKSPSYKSAEIAKNVKLFSCLKPILKFYW